jgi:hypothetical protein
MGRKTKKSRLPDSRNLVRAENAQSSNRADASAGDGRLVLAVCGLLLLAVATVFGQTVGHDFVNLDDQEYVYQNPYVLKGLTGQDIAWAFTHRVSAQWTPLTLLSLMADAQVFGGNGAKADLARLAAGMHFVSVALHAANVVLLFFVLRAMTGDLWPSALVAAIFAVHPLHVESVAWITERKDALSGLFGLLTLAAYVRYAHRPSVVRYLLVAAALALGLMAKPMLVTWPVLLLLLDFWPLRRQWNVQLLVEKVPLLLIVAVFAGIAFVGQQSQNTVASLESVPLTERIARAPVLYVDYLWKSLWPLDLAVLYPKEPLQNYGLAFGTATLLVLLTSAAFWGARRGKPWLAVGWLWFLGTLVPVIGLVQVGSVFQADRFLYLPQIGLCVAIVWGAADLTRAWTNRWPVAMVAAIVVAALIVCGWSQTSYWRNSEALWTHTIACTTDNYIAEGNLARDLADRNLLEPAIKHYRKELEIRPNSVDGHTNVANALARLGRYEEAIAHYRAALAIKPDDKLALHNLAYTLKVYEAARSKRERPNSSSKSQ